MDSVFNIRDGLSLVILLTRSLVKLLQLPAPVQFFDEATRFAPVRPDLDVKLEIDFGSDHAFDLEARRGADPFEHLSFLADQNSLLAFALAIDCRRNSRKSRAFFELSTITVVA